MATGSVYQILSEFPAWKGTKVVVALAQATPWLLVVRADLAAARGDVSAIKGLRLSAAGGGPFYALKQMAIRAGIEPGRDFELIVDNPATRSSDVSFGVAAARDLEAGVIDGFWANAMGAETVVGRGIGKVLIDVRRGHDPADVRHFSFAGLVTTDAYLERNAGGVAGAVRAIVKAQSMLRADPHSRARLGRASFRRKRRHS
jgi:NitT/TauT family transport system substrate-binding protein